MVKAKMKNAQENVEMAEDIEMTETETVLAEAAAEDAAAKEMNAGIETAEGAEAEAVTAEDMPEESAEETLADAEAEEAAAEIAAEAGEEAAAETASEAEEAAEDEDIAITQDDLRLVEAILFAAPTALTVSQIAERFPEGRVKLIPDVLEMLKEHYAARGVTLVQREKRWALRTSADLGHHLRLEKDQPKKFTRAAMETMAIIAYHQPVTRAEIENIRGVATSAGSLDALMEAGWIKPGKRREVPGRPVTWLTTQAFLDHFGLEKLEDLPGMEELKAAGLLDKRPAIEAMPTADLFDESVNKEDIDPNEVTDEDLLGKPDANDEVLPADAEDGAEGEDAADIENTEMASADEDEDADDDFDDEDEDGEDDTDEDDADEDGDDFDDEDGDEDDADDDADEDADDSDDDNDDDDDGDFDDEDDEDDDDDFDDEDDEDDED
ncbi:MAG: SMC-Scp complex subunit ScpB [Bdellovibrionales bacterium]|jgi:segregation and condensation protein B|nr:SMC-Scp complex subunit ScpB [Bdellovibrionales bacterium]